MTAMEERPHRMCPYHRKRTFESRKEARKAMKRRFPGERMWAYQCKWQTDGWHYGHVAAEVRSGEITREQFYGPNGVGLVREKQGTRRIVKKEAA